MYIDISVYVCCKFSTCFYLVLNLSFLQSAGSLDLARAWRLTSLLVVITVTFSECVYTMKSTGLLLPM